MLEFESTCACYCASALAIAVWFCFQE